MCGIARATRAHWTVVEAGKGAAKVSSRVPRTVLVTGGVAHAPGAGVGGQRSHGWQSADDSERTEARTASANVRRWGVGNPDLLKTHLLLPQEKLPKPNSIALDLLWSTGKGAAKVSSRVPRRPKARRAFADPLCLPFPVCLCRRSRHSNWTETPVGNGLPPWYALRVPVTPYNRAFGVLFPAGQSIPAPRRES